jgi:hypothetical protein
VSSVTVVPPTEYFFCRLYQELIPLTKLESVSVPV